MQLIDEARAEALFSVMGPATVVSGGSGANTAVGAALLGAKTGFVGKVRDDELGRLFSHDLKATGVVFETAAAAEGPATARCFILVTPDGERTMNTYRRLPEAVLRRRGRGRGAGGPRHLSRRLSVGSARRQGRVPQGGRHRPRRRQRRGPDAVGRLLSSIVTATSSGPHPRGQHRHLFANIGELQSLYSTDDPDKAIAAFRDERGGHGKHLLGLVTRSADGALVVRGGEVRSVEASPVRTRGGGHHRRGRLFAAGFLAGHARGLDYVASARLGTLAAAEVIEHIGARPQRDLLRWRGSSA